MFAPTDRQIADARRFAALHRRGAPIILFNVWDAGSAAAVVAAGAAAVATGSASLAGAQGFEDGEAIPLDFLLTVVRRIVATVDAPVSVDFEGGFAAAPAQVGEHAARLIETGAVGLNFEDQIVGAAGLYDIADQCARIAAIKTAAMRAGVDLFINARTDLFLKAPESDHAGLVEPALERARAYAEAGANGFFVPWLIAEDLIGAVCEQSPLPVNVMMRDGAPPSTRLTALGVARISYGPGPWRDAMAGVETAARAAMIL